MENELLALDVSPGSLTYSMYNFAKPRVICEMRVI